MRHVSKALINMTPKIETEFIEILNASDEKGVAPIVQFTIQSDPIKEVGVNGCQACDMLEYVKCLFQSLNSAIPNRETSITITKLEEAMHWQDARTADRERRMVEGTMEK